jgi:hypothetical protein
VPSSIQETIINDKDWTQWASGEAEVAVETEMVPDTLISSRSRYNASSKLARILSKREA